MRPNWCYPMASGSTLTAQACLSKYPLNGNNIADHFKLLVSSQRAHDGLYNVALWFMQHHIVV